MQVSRALMCEDDLVYSRMDNRYVCYDLWWFECGGGLLLDS